MANSLELPDWWIEPLDGGASSGCLNCGGRSSRHELHAQLGVGFGMCVVTKDGMSVWEENSEVDDYPALQEFEDMASQDPDHDWRVVYDAPMWSGTWQRQGDGEWNLIERGIGFA